MIGAIIFLFCFGLDLIAHEFVLRLKYIFDRKNILEYFNRFQAKRTEAIYGYARFYTGFRLYIESNLKQPLPKSFIIVANHRSLVDIAAILYAFRNYGVRFVAKKQLKYGIPTISLGARIGQHALIDRKGNFASTYRELIKLAKRTSRGLCPVVFPEGTRSRTGEIGNFHSAAVRLLVEHSNVPILSVALYGERKMVTFKELLKNMKNASYRVKLLTLYDHPKGRKATTRLLDEIREEISRQVKEWETKSKV